MKFSTRYSFFLLLLAACGNPPATPPPSAEPLYDSLRIQLETMYDADQEIRRILIDSIGLDSPEAGTYIGEMMRIDRENQLVVGEILDKHGWLGISQIGSKANGALFYVIQHSPDSLMAKYYPLLQAQADAGEATPKHAAMMLDRVLMNGGKRQRYGTQATSDSGMDNGWYIWPLQNPDSVDIWRQQVGFTTTVAEYAESMEASYDPQRPLPSEAQE